MRYKFSLNPRIKDYVEWQLEHYHEDKRQLEEYKQDLMPSTIANYTPSEGSTYTVGNPTERTAIKIMSSPYILSLERSTNAITRALDKLDDTDKRLIALVYWQRTHTIIGAGLKVGYGKTQAYAHINNILYLIALEMGEVSI